MDQLKTTVNQTGSEEKALEGLNRQMDRQQLIPVIKRKLPPPKPLGEESLNSLFNAYFNNKMTMILLMLQRGCSGADAMVSLKAVIFIEDLYHHLIRHEYQTSHARVFQWLKLFFQRYPHVKPMQKRKAVEYIRTIYGLFGLKLNPMI